MEQLTNMEYRDVIEDLKSRELEILEFKSSFHKDEIGRTMAAFSTKRGGKIYLGINEKREPIGIICGKNLFDKIQEVARVVYPPAIISIESAQHDKQRKIVRINVKRGYGGVYSYKNVSYERRGGINHPLKPEEVTSIDIKRKKFCFDELGAFSTHRPALIGDISENKVKSFLEFVKGKELEYVDLKQFLINYDLMSNDSQVKNAAIMFFGKNPLEFLPHCKVSISKFPSDEVTENFVKKEFSGDIMEIIKDTFLEIERSVTVFSSIKEYQRIDIPEYPIDALREGIVNSIAHRDYFIDSSEIFIKIFKSRIEITNPGGFPYKNCTFEEIEKSGLSIRRNPVLAKLLEDMKLMEQEGRGIRMIKELTKKHGLSKPKIETTTNTFKITFYGVGDKPKNILKSPFHRVTDLGGLNDNQIKLLRRLKKNQSITSKEYSKIFSLSERTAQRHLKQLFELNILKLKTSVKNKKIYFL